MCSAMVTTAGKMLSNQAILDNLGNCGQPLGNLSNHVQRHVATTTHMLSNLGNPWQLWANPQATLGNLCNHGQRHDDDCHKHAEQLGQSWATVGKALGISVQSCAVPW